MPSGRGGYRTPIAVAGALGLVVVLAAIWTVPWLVPDQDFGRFADIAQLLGTLLIVPGLGWGLWVWARHPGNAERSRPREQPHTPDIPSAPVGRPMAEVADPFALEVHRPITVTPAARQDTACLPALPPYQTRRHDHDLQDRLRAAVADGRSVVLTLVGGSSCGKTRACWEALQLRDGDDPLLEGWRLWHPFDPTRPEAALAGLNQVQPRTVIWLNEAQHYLLTPGTDHGEQLAAQLRSLLQDPARAPVIALGTIWPDYWDTLTRLPRAPERPEAPDWRGDRHAQARELLAGSEIPMVEAVDHDTVDRLRRGPDVDPRLREAAERAPDGALAQYLAGAPALLQRYDTAPPGPRAVLTAAIDLRRLGHGLAISRPLLAAIAPAYLTDTEWHQLPDTWFDRALHYVTQPCHGGTAPLTQLRPRPGQARSDHPRSNQPSYRLADYLEETGRHRRHRTIIPADVWPQLCEHVTGLDNAIALGDAAARRLLYRYAVPLLARDFDGDIDAFWTAQDQLLAELTTRADNGDERAARELAQLLGYVGDVDTLTARADNGDSSAADVLAQLLVARGDLDTLTARADKWAAYSVADLLVARGDLDTLTTRADSYTADADALHRLLGWFGDVGTLTARADNDDQEAAITLTELLVARGDLDGLTTRADNGDERAARALARLLLARGDLDTLTARANHGDTLAANQLIDVIAARDEPDDTDRLWPFTLTSLYYTPGDLDALTASADMGDPAAAHVLAELFVLRGDLDGLASRADNGDREAAFTLAELLVARGDLEGLTTRADNGDERAARALVQLLLARGDLDTLTSRADNDDREAAFTLTELLVARGDLDGLTTRADNGDEYAADGVAQLLVARDEHAALWREAMRGNDSASAYLVYRMPLGRGEQGMDPTQLS